ncbi:MAG: LexA family transcriptional regulator [Legionellaceae bacterium]|nr:LexA family transcriptional regulator [Legionellaceae bacterium]
MAELNIKKEIGKRILEARKAKGLTLKALGELAGDLKQTRLTNWEQGARSPGPEEIKLLAQALDVSPAFLMCLSDEAQVKTKKSQTHLVPLLEHLHYVNDKPNIETNCNQNLSSDNVFISVSAALFPELSDKAFALKMADESMIPDIKVNDILVIDPAISPEPGDFVLAKLANKPEAIVCQYKKLSYTSDEFELLTLNENWPNIKMTDAHGIVIVGKVIQNIRSF